jgi:hypothetical protein
MSLSLYLRLGLPDVVLPNFWLAKLLVEVLLAYEIAIFST